eukprot:m.109888 g.109888  ORF g.109888 m.109888 type:complete len:130 (+) comp14018_c0_seq4:141-530(+)
MSQESKQERKEPVGFKLLLLLFNSRKTLKASRRRAVDKMNIPIICEYIVEEIVGTKHLRVTSDYLRGTCAAYYYKVDNAQRDLDDMIAKINKVEALGIRDAKQNVTVPETFTMYVPLPLVAHLLTMMQI